MFLSYNYNWYINHLQYYFLNLQRNELAYGTHTPNSKMNTDSDLRKFWDNGQQLKTITSLRVEISKKIV